MMWQAFILTILISSVGVSAFLGMKPETDNPNDDHPIHSYIFFFNWSHGDILAIVRRVRFLD
jgi:hypothetical protein